MNAEAPRPAFYRGRLDCTQDRCENAPFASVGGLDARGALKAPDYVAEDERADYLRGYEAQADALFGEAWRTCAFGWTPAISISVGGIVAVEPSFAGKS